jgi:hypothetical protein
MLKHRVALAMGIWFALCAMGQSPETFKSRLAPVAVDTAMKANITGSGFGRGDARGLEAYRQRHVRGNEKPGHCGTHPPGQRSRACAEAHCSPSPLPKP